MIETIHMDPDALTKTFQDHLTSMKKLQILFSKLEKIQSDPAKRYIFLKKNVSQIEKIISTDQEWQAIYSELHQFCINLKEEYLVLEGSVRGKFGLALDAILKEKGFRLEGQYPTLKTSLYTIKTDLENEKVTLFYGPEAEKIVVCPASAEDVAKTLTAYHAKITGREFSDQLFFDTLYAAYLMVIQKSQKKIGDEIDIPEIISMVSILMQPKKFRQNPKKETYMEYGRIEFSYDLARLLNRRQKGYEIKLVSAVRGKTKSPFDFLYVPNIKNPAQWEPISGIKFIEVNNA